MKTQYYTVYKGKSARIGYEFLHYSENSVLFWTCFIEINPKGLDYWYKFLQLIGSSP